MLARMRDDHDHHKHLQGKLLDLQEQGDQQVSLIERSEWSGVFESSQIPG
jgi:hypothetical protein